MRRWTLVLGISLLGLGLGVIGCPPIGQPTRERTDPPRIRKVRLNPLPPGGKLIDPRDYRLIVRIQLTTVRLPMGATSKSEDLWSYINEEPLGVRTGVTLARNGVRVGLGVRQARTDVDKILRRLTGKPLSPTQLEGLPGSPMALVLKRGQGDQTIFLFRPDGTLTGADYPPGDNLLMLTANIDPDDPTTVRMVGSAVIRSTRRRQRFVDKPGGIVRVSEPNYFPLEDAGFKITVPAGGFILVGPGPKVGRVNSLGRRFLVHADRGMEFETVLVIAPKVFAAPIKPHN